MGFGVRESEFVKREEGKKGDCVKPERLCTIMEEAEKRERRDS